MFDGQNNFHYLFWSVVVVLVVVLIVVLVVVLLVLVLVIVFKENKKYLKFFHGSLQH